MSCKGKSLSKTVEACFKELTFFCFKAYLLVF